MTAWRRKPGCGLRRSRVVQRSNNNANANGGVAYVNANSDSSSTNANIGSRLDNIQKSKDITDGGDRLRVADGHSGGPGRTKPFGEVKKSGQGGYGG